MMNLSSVDFTLSAVILSIILIPMAKTPAPANFGATCSLTTKATVSNTMDKSAIMNPATLNLVPRGVATMFVTWVEGG